MKADPFFIRGLQYALKHGFEGYAGDTPRRKTFVDDNHHLISGTMLVAVFAYLESTLGENWIARCGGKETRELNLLKMIRNAFVHKNGHIRDLGAYDELFETDLRDFIADLRAGKVTDDYGNVCPPYIEIDDNGVVKLTIDAINVLAGIGVAICH